MEKIIKLTIVNLITIVRLIGAIILPFVYIKHGANITSIYIIILYLTDAIDGFLARTLKVSTFFGSAMDAGSDKLLNAVSFIILGIEYNIMLAPLAIEIAIMYTSYNTYRYGGNVQSTIKGKIKMVVLSVFVILSFALLSLPALKINSTFINKLMGATDLIIHIFAFLILFACLVALFDYINLNKLARLNPKSDEIKVEKKKKKTFKQVLHDLFDTDYYKKHKDESIIKQFYIKN